MPTPVALTMCCTCQVFELGGDVVAPALAHGLMRLVAEGAGEGDEAADAELRAQAANAYLRLLAKPKLPDILLKVRLHAPAAGRAGRLGTACCRRAVGSCCPEY